MQTPQNHNKHDRMVKRAVRIVPARQRPHYTKIWSAELARAGTTTERARVARAAIETARRLRLKDIAALLRGEHGLAGSQYSRTGTLFGPDCGGRWRADIYWVVVA